MKKFLPDLIATPCVALLMSNLAQAATPATYVLATGTDSATCGDLHFACRTISQAIHNAPSGGTVLVGPGYYGDVDGDGSLSGPEEEKGCQASGKTCLIDIDKPLTVVSTDGARVTHIGVSRAGSTSPALESHIAVMLSSRNTLFGAEGTGFTVSGAKQAAGVAVSGGGDMLRINGNIFTNNQIGLLIEGTGQVVYAFSNFATGNGTGFEIRGRRTHLANDVAQDNGIGFNISGLPSQENSRLRQNTAVNNDVGFQIKAPYSQFEGNIIVGNLHTGMRFVRSTVPGAIGGRNQIFGNGGAAGSPSNCGVTNDTGGPLSASGNYWGAATGPGADPADAVCNSAGSTTTVNDFLPYARQNTQYSRPVPY